MPRLTRHYAHWPEGVPHTLEVQDRHLFSLLEDSAKASPAKTALYYYGREISYQQLYNASLMLAGYLQQHFEVQHGDRIVLLMQNCPQFVIAYYAALRCGAIVVAINAMSTTEEISYYFEDSGARVLVTTQEIFERVQPLLNEDFLRGCIIGATSEFAGCQQNTPYLDIPDFVREPRRVQSHAKLHEFSAALAAGIAPLPLHGSASDLAVIAYTSGTTGKPKGAMLTHRNFNYNIRQRALWLKEGSHFTAMLVMPVNHMGGMFVMNLAMCNGQTLAILSRWNVDTALELIERCGVNSWAAVTPMLAELMARPDIEQRNLASLERLYVGATAMPEALAQRIKERLKLTPIESYGMSETCGATHVNPPHSARLQCGGVPYINTDARVIDPHSGEELGANQPGEIVMNSPIVFAGYWNKPEATRESFIEIDGKPFLRSGDIGYYDEDGYFYISDRLKRMINASGHKVWPAEVENALYAHPAVQEACVISAYDAKRGETVKAFVILRPTARGTLKEDELSEWARGRLSAYKVPRIVEFVDSLPKTATGKTLWRDLQQQQDERDRALRGVVV
ncbi:AMP-binding protein [Pseudomonas sp. H9]|uniref:AMP-binding protein n=1 Tax=Pseudomonas sp. H9 TaxID=483968 RepID=UPI001057DADB|nr:AMP-binding protein [Pseudomonas sp. H9]TDF83777.1 long-chain-fatty-acid--CoA ligase LcfA [Pseudomonas sp. H9]